MSEIETVSPPLPYSQLTLDGQRNVTSCSQDFSDLVGEDVVGSNFDKLISQTDRAGHAAYLSNLASYQGGFLDVFASLKTNNESQLARIRMRRDEQSEWFVLVETLCEGEPIRRLLQSREHQRAVIRDASEGIAFLDDETRILELNPNFLEAGDFRSKHGVRLNEASITGRRFTEFATEPFQPIVEAFGRENLRERTFDDRIHLEDRVLQVKLTPTFLARDMFVGYVLSLEDLTSEEELDRLRIESARNVGQAEIATAILHNVGNSLNSLSVGQEVLVRLAQSPLLTNLDKAVDMLDCEDPSEFLKSDLGKRCIPCLRALMGKMAAQKNEVLSELSQLSRHIDHIRSIVNKQQQYAKNTAMLERCCPHQLFEDALEMTLHEPARKGISVEKNYEETREYELDRHRIVEILVNLLKNAIDAVMATDSIRLISVSTKLDDDDYFSFTVRDSGIGIEEEDIQRIFQRGFTTKESGHGFGLHGSACIAAEMKGTLSCQSEGAGKGATFNLRIPRTPVVNPFSPNPVDLSA